MQTRINSGTCEDFGDSEFTSSHICVTSESYIGTYGVLQEVHKGICADNNTNGEIAEERYRVCMHR